MTIDTFLRFIHSWNRWLLVATIVVALVYFIRGWMLTKPWTKTSQTLLTVFTSLVDLQWLLGLILLIRLGSLTGFGFRHYWEHLVAQTIALIVAHLHAMWRKKDLDDRSRHKRSVLLIGGVILLVVAGISVLPAGMQWRFVGV